MKEIELAQLFLNRRVVLGVGQVVMVLRLGPYPGQRISRGPTLGADHHGCHPGHVGPEGQDHQVRDYLDVGIAFQGDGKGGHLEIHPGQVLLPRFHPLNLHFDRPDRIHVLIQLVCVESPQLPAQGLGIAHDHVEDAAVRLLFLDRKQAVENPLRVPHGARHVPMPIPGNGIKIDRLLVVLKRIAAQFKGAESGVLAGFTGDGLVQGAL